MAKMSRDKGKRFCDCGCGEEIPAINKKGLPARFKHGHNARKLDYEVRDCGYSTPCWVFSNGGERYGRIRRNNRQYPAHRFMYEQMVGPIPQGLTLDHLCRNKRCINPDHLEAVTQTENTRRAMGLTEADVLRIRATHAAASVGRRRARPGTIQRLAAEYGVDEKTIKNVSAGRTWA